MKDLNVQGMAVAKYLQTQRNVRKVYYTGLPDHPHATLAATYLTGHGGVVSFELRATKRQAMRFVEHLRDPFMGTNFGSQHSMVELCSVFTYYNQTPRERIRLGISDTLIRLNVGHGQAGRVIEDLEAALRVI
jgi:cystathionine gamma-synthase